MTALPSSVAASLDELALIGGARGGGTTRLAWSPDLFAAYDWIGARLRALGLATEVDAAGNLLGYWHAESGKSVLVGSHLDTVPSGGRLDGALGVVAAVHAVAVLKQEGFQPARPLWIGSFMDEEGARFGTALFGSRAFAGEDVIALGARTDANGVALRTAMSTAGFDLDLVGGASRINDVGSYLELHIEQGPVLESEQLQVGLVTSIVGLRGYRVRLVGQANHAGTTPMHSRRDALAGSARVALALRDEARRREGMTANVGNIRVEPGGANVVPGLAEFTIDVRSSDHASLAEIEDFVEKTVTVISAEEGLEATLEQTFALEPLELDAALVAALERAAVATGATLRRMASGAGHDAMVIGRHVPAAMLFIPSRGGISHSPAEHSSPDDIELGMHVLAGALRELLSS